MNQETHNKVQATHLQRNAYLYVRQSTLRQVFENTESTKRQYALRERAIALGWSTEQIIVLDGDQGHSGASSADRHGFQTLVTEVGMGRAGIVLGLEVSRLARNSADWHRLLEICALMSTLILDEDGIYDPCHFNDRLLLGLKGTMSEAELYVLRARLRGGVLNKARRGELKLPLPAGFLYTADDRVILDPDQQVQHSIRYLFETFRRTGSAGSTVKTFREQGLLYPRRVNIGPHCGELVWGALVHSRVLSALHNPRYAGAFYYGQHHYRKGPDGRVRCETVAQKDWLVLLPQSHAGYITWEDFEENQRILRENTRAYQQKHRKSPPREGPALLQGLVLCGVCGGRMSVHYKTRRAGTAPTYVCQRHGIEHSERRCQSLFGADIDAAVGQLLIEAMTPMALEVSLHVQQELQSRIEEADRLRSQRVERARYEAELAKRRYMQVDPANRLVADALEAQWNESLRGLGEAQETYERQRESDRVEIDAQQRMEILSLASDFPRLWNDPETPSRDRKRMAHLLLEDVTLLKGETVTVHIRFKGGATRTLSVPFPTLYWQSRQTKPEVVQEVEALLALHTEGQAAVILNGKGMTTGDGVPFTTQSVKRIRMTHHLKSHSQHLKEEGYLTVHEMAQHLHICPGTVQQWARNGRIRSTPRGERKQMYKLPEDFHSDQNGECKLTNPGHNIDVNSNRTHEV